METILTNARIVLGDEVITGTLHLKDGAIAGVDTTASTAALIATPLGPNMQPARYAASVDVATLASVEPIRMVDRKRDTSDTVAEKTPLSPRSASGTREGRLLCVSRLSY